MYKRQLEEKKQVIARSEILEFFEAKSSQDDIGGLNVLKVWLNQRYRAFSKEARESSFNSCSSRFELVLIAIFFIRFFNSF